MLSTKVSFINNDYLLNPTKKQSEEESDLNMMVSFVGKERLFLAVEAEVNILPEEKVLGAIEFARNNLDTLYDFIEGFAKEVNPENTKYKYESKALSEALINDVSAVAKEKIVEMMRQGWDKIKMKAALQDLFTEVNTALEGKYKKSEMARALDVIEKSGGGGWAVSEKDILDWVLRLYETEGIFGQDVAGVTLAGIYQGIQNGDIKQGDLVVANITGTGYGRFEDDLEYYGREFGFASRVDNLFQRIGLSTRC